MSSASSHEPPQRQPDLALPTADGQLPGRFRSDRLSRYRQRLSGFPLGVAIQAGAALLIALAALAYSVATYTGAAPKEIAYTDLLHAIDTQQLGSILVRPGDEVRAWMEPNGLATDLPADFIVEYPVSTVDELAERARAQGVRMTLAPANEGSIGSTLNLLATLAVVGVVGAMVFRRGGGQMESLSRGAQSTTTFADVAGTQGAREELHEMVEFLKNPQRYAALGARTPKGALLVGPPGTGKTLLARAVAGEAGVPFFSISGSEVTGFLVGLGAQRIKKLFRQARKKGGVIFIDEIDALGGRRGSNQSHNEDDRTLNQLLVEMDGFSATTGVVVIAATNRADHLDEALKRPGRFDRMISVPTPSSPERAQILELHVRKRGIPLHEEVSLDRVARLSPGASGADLENLLNEAAIAAAREGGTQIRQSHVEQARDRILLGRERRDFRALDRERCIVAYHEAGHALVGVVCAPEDGLHKVTIQPRGQAMGVAFFSPSDDRMLYRRNYLEGVIMKGLAGRAAEEIVFGQHAVTSGAQNDLVQVNDVARKMVYQLGMGADTGLLIHTGEPGAISPAAHARMDEEVRRILESLFERTRDLLTVNREPLAALATALLEHETLSGPEAIDVLEDAGLSRPVELIPTGVEKETLVLA